MTTPCRSTVADVLRQSQDDEDDTAFLQRTHARFHACHARTAHPACQLCAVSPSEAARQRREAEYQRWAATQSHWVAQWCSEGPDLDALEAEVAAQFAVTHGHEAVDVSAQGRCKTAQAAGNSSRVTMLASN